MQKDIFISTSSTETRIAILEDMNLVELYVEQPENERMVGDIFKGKVENVVQSVQAAFVDVGLEQNGFLPFAEVGSQLMEFSALAETVSEEEEDKPRRNRRRSGRSHGRRTPVSKNQDIIVQVTKEPIGTKGARLTTEVSLPGRFVVLVPNNSTIGVSRKIADFKERRRLRMLAKSLRPEGFGLIMRTVCMGKDVATIQSDLEDLVKLWKRIEEKALKNNSPKLIFKDVGMTSSVIRDLFTPDIHRLVVDSRKLYIEIQKYLKYVAPTLANRLELHKDRKLLFDAYQIETQIEKSFARKIWMKGGAHIIFDHTEAMVVVDVNSGRSTGQKDHELNALEIDLLAAKEIARQLRLRDIGGIIVIDFIDLAKEKHRKLVISEIRKELKKDRAAFDILPMNDFGLVSLTRERVRPSLLYRYSESCPRCEGLGRVPSKATIMTQIERQILQIKINQNKRRLLLRAHPDIVDYLTAGFRSRIRLLKLKHLVSIKVERDSSLKDEGFQISARGQEEDDS